MASIVRGCSDTDLKPKPPWLDRKQTYIERLSEEPPEVIRVSLADKLHNARTILRDYRQLGENLWERFDPHADQVWYYGTLLEVYRRISESPMVRELGEVVGPLEFETALGSLSRLMTSGGYVTILGDPRRESYAEFSLGEGGLVLQVPRADRESLLAELDFNPPIDGDPNWWQVFEPSGPSDLYDIVRKARYCLAEVYGVTFDRPISIETSWRAERRSLAAVESEWKT